MMPLVGKERNVSGKYLTSNPDSFEIRDVRIGPSVVLRRNEPLVLHASQCGPDGCYRADVPGLDISIAACSRGEMFDAFCDLIAVLWEEYALEDDADLTLKARKLKTRLLRDYAVVE